MQNNLNAQVVEDSDLNNQNGDAKVKLEAWGANYKHVCDSCEG